MTNRGQNYLRTQQRMMTYIIINRDFRHTCGHNSDNRFYLENKS